MSTKIPKFRLAKRYLTDVSITEPILITWPSGTQSQGMSTRNEDHPKFAELRQKLSDEGFIKVEKGWHNGDRVLKPFYFNGMKFSVNDKFLCAVAMGVYLEVRKSLDKINYYGNATTKRS